MKREPGKVRVVLSSYGEGRDKVYTATLQSLTWVDMGDSGGPGSWTARAEGRSAKEALEKIQEHHMGPGNYFGIEPGYPVSVVNETGER